MTALATEVGKSSVTGVKSDIFSKQTSLGVSHKLSQAGKSDVGITLVKKKEIYVSVCNDWFSIGAKF